MVGNDIVDLGDSETRSSTLHPRFDDRVFASEELDALAKSASRERMRWILWAAKESAYKAARRRCAQTVFSPARFVVSLDDALCGSVAHLGRRIPVRVTQIGDCVHAVASEDGCYEDAIWGQRPLSAAERPDPGRFARALAISRVSRRLGVPSADLEVERVGRIPRLVDKVGSGFELSLSHHGSWVGFACRLRAEPVERK